MPDSPIILTIDEVMKIADRYPLVMFEPFLADMDAWHNPDVSTEERPETLILRLTLRDIRKTEVLFDETDLYVLYGGWLHISRSITREQFNNIGKPMDIAWDARLVPLIKMEIKKHERD